MPRDIDDAEPVAVVLDHREDRPPDTRRAIAWNVPLQVGGVDFDPRIEARAGARRLGRQHGRPGHRRQSRCRCEKESARNHAGHQLKVPGCCCFPAVGRSPSAPITIRRCRNIERILRSVVRQHATPIDGGWQSPSHAPRRGCGRSSRASRSIRMRRSSLLGTEPVGGCQSGCPASSRPIIPM